MRKKFDKSSKKYNHFLKSSSNQKKDNSARGYFRQLQKQPSSVQLKDVLSAFSEPKLIDYEHLVEGVKKFIKLANASPVGSESAREKLYGTVYSGLHYNNDLAKLWNARRAHEPIKASQITTFAPWGWDSILQDGFITLIYKGQQPAQALDDLVKGPTVIDCGMFAQLSLWFGIRYMLGNQRFNECFGRAPFFITQNVYNPIKEHNKPFSGNPLCSFLSKKEAVTVPSVTVKHLTNTPLYRFKHPGGADGGENCIVIDDQYYLFAPHLENTHGITEASVLSLLRDAFNEDRKIYDTERLSLYAATPEAFHPRLGQTYGQLLDEAEKLRDTTLTQEEFSHVEQYGELDLAFDLYKFSIWLQRMKQTMSPDPIEYMPQSIDDSCVPIELLQAIPFENKTTMDFFQFKQDTPQQKKFMAISQQFCQSVLVGEPKFVILSGNSGVGKTASAVCAAKELAARGKKIVWISENMVKGWADKAKSLSDLDACSVQIDKLLASNPDAVFLDDDNLVGSSGRVLLEKVYFWYVSHSGKGLFITSNESVCFEECYGYNLSREYDCPPFSHYDSEHYLNWQCETGLSGESLRLKRDGQSIGAIVSDLAWKSNESKMASAELIPAFDEDELIPIRKPSAENSHAYDKLRPVQQQWLYVGRSKLTSDCVAYPLKFEKTTCKTIALEMRDFESYSRKVINTSSMEQLIRILNYAHDQGGRRVILINQTSYSAEELLAQIKTQLPKSESERIWSRLRLLLCETEDSIFNHDQFNGRIEMCPTTSGLPNKRHSVSTQLMVRRAAATHKNQELGLYSVRLKRDVNCFFRDNQLFRDKIKRIPTEIKEGVISIDVFTEQFHDKREEAFLIEHRHDNAKAQHKYDKRFGMVLRK